MTLRPLFNSVTFVSLCVLAVACGCSTSSTVQNATKANEYRQVLERNKRAMPAEEDQTKNLPALTKADYERRGDAYIREGSMDLALVQYMKALSLDAGQSGVRYKAGRLFLQKGLTEEALKEFQSILTYDPYNALAYEGIGRVFFRDKDFQKAEGYLLRAVELDKGLWEAHNLLGVLYNNRMEVDKAIAHYEEAILIRPKTGVLFNNIGMSYLLKGDYEKAARSFTEALRLDGPSPKVYNNLAVSLYKAGKYAEALGMFRKAADESTALNNLGYLYLADGRLDEAAKLFEMAIESNPKYYVTANQNLRKARNGSSLPSQP